MTLMTDSLEQAPPAPFLPALVDGDDRRWIAALRDRGVDHEDAVRRLHKTVEQAARHQVRRMPHVWAALGVARAEEIIDSAADEATMAVLGSLGRFEGRSRFTTWAYKFGIYHAATEARRAMWHDRPVALDDTTELMSRDPMTPEAYAETRDFAAAVTHAMRTVLTSHQRSVAHALIVEEVPIDVLAERMATNRNALYKTLHDARVKLRAELLRLGFVTSSQKGR